MAFRFRVRSALSFVAAAAACVVAGCAEPPPPEAPEVPAGLNVSQRLIDMASGYRAYVNRARSMSPAFVDGAAVANALSAGAAYDPQQFVRGAIAYGAVVALQDRTFTGGVRASASTPTQRQEMAYAILRDPYYVTSLPGAASAASAVSAALTTDGQAIYDQGGRIKQAAYDIQAQAWASSEVPDRPMRLQRVKAPPPLAGDLAESERLRTAISSAAAPAASVMVPAPTAYPSIAVRALGVAAIAALGYSGDTQPDLMTPLMVDAVGGNCLNLAKLDLYQCLAVSKPHYEDVFCLGRHAMMDTGLCLMKSTGAPLPAIEVKVISTGSPTSQAYKAAPKWKPKASAKPKAKSR